MRNRLLPLIFMLFHLWSIAVLDTVEMKKCASVKCGSVDISYPFWIPDQQAEYCGYPSLEINCRDEKPFLVQSYDTNYYIDRVFYDNNSFVLINSLLVNWEPNCSVPRFNVSINLGPMVVSKTNKELVFFFDCAQMSLTPANYLPVTCVAGQPDNAANRSFVRLLENYTDGASSASGESLSNCSISRVPVSGWSGWTADQYTTLMNDGFLVEMKVTSCSGCLSSRGQCGFNISNYMFMCICPDGNMYPMSCPNPQAISCNTSFKIQYPFYVYNDSGPECDDPTQIGCLGKGIGCSAPIRIRCNGNVSQINISGLDHSLQLENISYSDSTLITSDDYFHYSLIQSNCTNATIVFEPHIDIEPDSDKFRNENDLFSSIQCDLKTRRLPVKVCEGRRCLYDIKEMNFPVTCSAPPPFSICWRFSFNQTGGLTLLSASFSNDPSREGEAGITESPEKTSHPATKAILIAGISVGIGGFLVVCCALQILALRFFFKYGRLCIFQRNHGEQKEIEMLIEKYGSLSPKRYNYRELKKITKSFQDRLGKGGFGTVYKGSLLEGGFVAVKLLHNATKNGEEFLNEVISIGRTSHVNVVNLLGFCIEGSKRALIYEYMPNGSLDNYIYSENPRDVLGGEKLYDIAISIARGIEYLHRGCNTRIVHFDIKPQNILLDEDFCPKIADFGLAKLCQPKESIISLAEMRGTIGYIAPEVFSRSFGVPSTKSDVYSYGMVVLDMVRSIKNARPMVENASEDYFPHWIYDFVVQGREIETHNATAETEGITRKMAIVGLWCIQTVPANRPSMSGVLEMLEKSLDELEMPPKPYLSSPQHSILLSLNSTL